VKSLNLLHLNTERGWRGGEVQTLLLARGLAERGHRCVLVAPPESRLVAEGRKAGLEVEAVDARGEFDPGAVLALARLVRKLGPELLHYHTSHAVTLGTLAMAFSRRIPAVASRRVSFPLSRNPLARLKYTHRVVRVIAVSSGIREILVSSGIPSQRVVTIHSAVDLQRFRTVPSREESRAALGYDGQVTLVGAIGHLAEHKGHRVLVEAAWLLALGPGDFRFLVVGGGELEAVLRRRIQELGLQETFRLLGHSDRVDHLLPALDMLVFPSLSGEGSPAVLKEAMACGVPIVASGISGVEEVVEDGREGLLVRPGDPQILKDVILRLASDRNLRLQLGRHGRERAREFSVERMVERTQAVYREVLERGTRSKP
jgi:glycosyltransferase involved in cell wall biosynthesis